MPGEFADLISLDFPEAGSGGGGGGGMDVNPIPTLPDFKPSFGGGYNLGGGDSSSTKLAPDTLNMDVGKGDPSGGSGFGDLAKTLGGAAKSASPFMNIATGAMGIYSGITGAQRSAQQAALQRRAQKGQEESATATRAAAAPLTQFGTEELARGQAGQIPPAIQARIDQWKQGFLAAARDRLAKMGQGDSQALMQWEQFAEQQAQAMAADYLQEEMRMGTQNLQAGAQTIASAGGQQGAVAQGANVQGDAIERLIEQANKTLSSLNAGAS